MFCTKGPKVEPLRRVPEFVQSSPHMALYPRRCFSKEAPSPSCFAGPKKGVLQETIRRVVRNPSASPRVCCANGYPRGKKHRPERDRDIMRVKNPVILVKRGFVSCSRQSLRKATFLEASFTEVTTLKRVGQCRHLRPRIMGGRPSAQGGSSSIQAVIQRF